MKGTRPLDNDEIRRVSVAFTGTYEVRNRGLFMLGVSTGGRISELLSLQIGDVYQNGSAVTDLLFEKSVVKGGEVSRAVPVNRDGRHAIDDLINCIAITTKTQTKAVRYSVATQIGDSADASSNGARYTQKSVYRGGLERQAGDT